MPGSAPSVKRKRSEFDARRGNATERGYDTTWKKLSRIHIAAEPFCRRCFEMGISTPAALVDHIVPVDEAPELRLVDSNLQSLCRPCHAEKTYGEDKRGQAFARPFWIKPAVTPVTIVCGPPCSGKSTYVAEHKAEDELVIDVDAIACELLGLAFTHAWPRSALDDVLHHRNRLLGQLSIAPAHWKRAWFIVGEPTMVGRAWWRDKLKPQDIIVCETPALTCYDRLALREAKSKRDEVTRRAVSAWWDVYERDSKDIIVRPVSQGGTPRPGTSPPHPMVNE